LDSLSSRISEDIDETEIVTSGDQSAVFVHVNTVDVVTTNFFREDTGNEPSELDVMRAPLHTLSVGSTTAILTAVRNLEEENFVTVADRSNVCAVDRPIKGSNSCVMLGASTSKAVTSFNIVDSDVGVVRSNSEIFTARTVLSDLNPLLGVGELMLDISGTHGILVSNGDGTVITSGSNVTVGLVDSDAS
jgi:hypothetical protein